MEFIIKRYTRKNLMKYVNYKRAGKILLTKEKEEKNGRFCACFK